MRVVGRFVGVGVGVGLCLVGLYLVGGCGGDSGKPIAAGVAADSNSTLATVQTELRPVALERVWDGVVEAVNQGTVSAQTSGRVTELPFDVDDHVPAGAVIVRFTAVEQQSGQRQAAAQLRGAEAAHREAEADFNRIQSVYARKLVARAQLDQAIARRDTTGALLESAQAALRAANEQLQYTVVRAPFAGVVTRRHVAVGETVQPGQPLLSGIGVGDMRISVVVPQSEAESIRTHNSAAILLDSAGAARVAAHDLKIFPYADPQTHSIEVRLGLPANAAQLKPGTTVKVAFVVGTERQRQVPWTAVLQRSELTAVYVRSGDGVQLRQVRLGHRHGAQVEVHAGLRDGEQVVVDAAAAVARVMDSARRAAEQ